MLQGEATYLDLNPLRDVSAQFDFLFRTSELVRRWGFNVFVIRLRAAYKGAFNGVNSDPTDDDALIERAYVPGLARAGGVLSAGILSAPGSLALYSVPSSADMSPIASAYAAAGSTHAFATSRASLDAPAVVRAIVG